MRGWRNIVSITLAVAIYNIVQWLFTGYLLLQFVFGPLVQEPWNDRNLMYSLSMGLEYLFSFQFVQIAFILQLMFFGAFALLLAVLNKKRVAIGVALGSVLHLATIIWLAG